MAMYVRHAALYYRPGSMGTIANNSVSVPFALLPMLQWIQPNTDLIAIKKSMMPTMAIYVKSVVI